MEITGEDSPSGVGFDLVFTKLPAARNDLPSIHRGDGITFTPATTARQTKTNAVPIAKVEQVSDRTID